MTMGSNTIRLYSETGDVDEVMSRFRSLLKTYGDALQFNLAEIKMPRPQEISPDINVDDHYPLRLFSKTNGMTVLVSEVRTGYCGASVDAMFECLRLAKFRLSALAINSIKNQRELRLKIWNDGISNIKKTALTYAKCEGSLFIFSYNPSSN